MSNHIGRFIPFEFATAAQNMAIDEAILEAHTEGTVPTTLRVYGFAPPAVSIGYGQDLSRTNIDKIRSFGLDIVRRPTGGRAVLHLRDFTYSFVGQTKASESGNSESRPLLSQSVISSYKQICQGLINALEELDIESEIGRSQPIDRSTQNCFAQTTQADLHHKGKKLIGSAQLRRNNVLLQHGSLVLENQSSIMTQLFSADTEPVPANILQELEDLLNKGNIETGKPFCFKGKEFTLQQLESAFKHGFEQAFNIKFENQLLTGGEKELSCKIQQKSLNTVSNKPDS